MRVVLYRRVSTAEQEESGLGLTAQRIALVRECEARAWEIVADHHDAESGSSMRKRPRLALALADLAAAQADVLLVSRADRIVRSLRDWVELTERSRREGWALVALDAPGDPTTPHGEAMQSMQIVFAQLERRLIGQRTREALAVKRAAGVKLGRPRTLPDEIRTRIRRERAEDRRSYAEIARRLTAEGIPTGQGAAKWSDTTVRKVALAPV